MSDETVKPNPRSNLVYEGIGLCRKGLAHTAGLPYERVIIFFPKMLVGMVVTRVPVAGSIS